LEKDVVARVLVTGGAGFIGSHICDKLIYLGHEVVCYDNLMTGFKSNIEHLLKNEKFTFIEGDIRDCENLRMAINGCTHVSHQAALGSVPRSIENPIRTNEINIQGSLNVLVEAKNKSIKRVVFASSSSVYGDNMDMPKVESNTGNVLSPYAVTKLTIEEYARVFAHVYQMETIGLRYFNVFGPRQSPQGAYAAVIPVFIDNILNDKISTINGDGGQTRDFSYIDNVVKANILSLFEDSEDAYGEVYNVACGETLSINDLYDMIQDKILEIIGEKSRIEAKNGPDRAGDIRDSLANLTKIKKDLGYEPEIFAEEGMLKTCEWHISNRS
tara:strand:+ start:973 stop:1956 length:984 start_codon:yes stop_codon:yes gene_type:complete